MQSSLRRRVHPGQAQLATVWPRRSPSLPQASGQLRPSPRRQPALQLLRGDDHRTAGIRAPFRGLQGALASQLRSGIKHERPCTSGLQEASRAQIFYSLAPHPHCSSAAHDLQVSGVASFLLSRLVSPISVGRRAIRHRDRPPSWKRNMTGWRRRCRCRSLAKTLFCRRAARRVGVGVGFVSVLSKNPLVSGQKVAA